MWSLLQPLAGKGALVGGGSRGIGRAVAAELARLARAAWIRRVETIAVPGVAPARKGPSGYLTAKNLVFYALACALAERNGADCVAGGHTRKDGRTYRGARTGFFRTFRRLLAAARPDPLGIPRGTFRHAIC